MIKYKIDVLSALKIAGYSTYRLQKEKILSSSTINKIKRGEMVSAPAISTVCRLLKKQPGDILEYVPD